jgi:hypothetical protein
MRQQMRFNRVLGAVVALAAFAMSWSSAALAAPPARCQTYAECKNLGIAAYFYGYPLVIMGVSADVATNVPDATSQDGRAPVNQFSHNGLPDETYLDIVLPSVSTPYSNAVLDLTKEPVVMHLPDFGDRWFLVQVLDFWTNSAGEETSCEDGTDGFCAVGTRYGTTEGDYAFVGPGFTGSLPASIKQRIVMPTNQALLAGRIFTEGTGEDMEIVRAFQAQMSLTPLGQYGKSFAPRTNAPVSPHIDMDDGPRDQVAALDAGAFFKRLAELMVKNPPLPGDGPAVAAISRIGIVPGKPFDIRTLDAATRQAVIDGYAAAQALLVAQSTHYTLTSTYWSMSLDLGNWGTRYAERAIVAYGALGANLYKDAVYAGGIKDSANEDLIGDHRYKLHFAAGALPPAGAEAFWSVTLYARPQENLYGNPLHRYALGIPTAQGHAMQLNADGSLDIFLQHDAPPEGTLQHDNWIPTPGAGAKYLLLLRMYDPTNELFEGGWVPPAVERINS